MGENKKVQLFNRIFLGAHLIFSIILAVYRIVKGQGYLLLLAVCSFALLLLPGLAFKLLRRKSVPQLNALVYLYCLLSFTFGMALQAYHEIPLYDKIIHTLSGAFFAFIGLFIYTLLKPEKQVHREEFSVTAAFSFSFSMMIAAVWEIYEYFLSIVSTTDPQNVLMTGVNDTMQDMIVCLIGAVLFIIPEYLYFKKGRKDLFMASYEAVMNGEKSAKNT